MVVVGKYSPTSLFSKLQASIEREQLFCEMFKRDIPDLSISHQSVEACRVAFGLGIPSISTADAPHADAVNKLTLPLLKVLIISKAIPPHHYTKYGYHFQSELKPLVL